MKLFPKKYKVQDLHNRAKKYRNWDQNNTSNNNDNCTFSVNPLPISTKLSYHDFFLIYIKDFLNRQKHISNKQNYEQLFLVYSNQLQNLCSSYKLFNKKRQTLPQVWTNKLERYTSSQNKKNFNANNKILENYLSSPHKIYIPDSDCYIYILKQFHSLWDKWKITNKSNVWYRSFNLQTSIPSENISWKEEKIPCYTLKYFVWAKCEALPIYAEDVDLCCWDVALLIHPKDKRYNKYIWKKAIIPLCNRQIPIIGDENVNIAIDNWIKRVCPCANQESIELAKKYWLPTDIYVFNQQWLYTEYIHEPAFIWQERSKYYDNIVWFIEDIGNLAEKWSIIKKVPYLNEINERLVPYKIDQFIIDLGEEKQKIINQIVEKKISFSFLNEDFWDLFDKIEHDTSLNNPKSETEDTKEKDSEWENITNNPESDTLQIKQQIIDKINEYLPDSIICNSQSPFWWKLPVIKKTNWENSFFDIEDMCLKSKDKPMQLCFNFILLSLIRAWALWIKKFWNNKDNKLCECDKLFSILSQNEKKIQYFVEYLSKITWEKDEYSELMEIIQNLTDENNPTTNSCKKLIDNCKFIKQEWNQIILEIKWISNDIIDPEFLNLCVPSYLYEKNIQLNNQVVIDKNGRNEIFKQLLVQELLLWKVIYNEVSEYTYNQSNEFLWNNQLTKFQLEQNQRDFFSIYGENPIRLNLLTTQAYDQKEILLNNIFLKQIRNATRLCIQKDFLPLDIKKCIENHNATEFEDFDLSVLYRLNELYDDFQNVKSYDQYIHFFNNFKKTIQDIFFSWYIEIQKVYSTNDVQFVCSYFFSFLLSVLYPLVPEFVDALQYVSDRKFILQIKPIQLNRWVDYNMNILYNTFITIKNIKLECNIKQHENCNIFIKSNPSILDIFTKYEEIFKSYFHITDISYIRLHEQNPLWYEIFSDDAITVGIQSWTFSIIKEKDSIESIERDIKNLEDKLDLLRQRIQLLPEWEQRTKTEEEYAKTKEEIETLTIKHSLLNSK